MQTRIMLRGVGGMVKLLVGRRVVPVPHVVKPVQNIPKKGRSLGEGRGQMADDRSGGHSETAFRFLPAFAPFEGKGRRGLAGKDFGDFAE